MKFFFSVFLALFISAFYGIANAAVADLTEEEKIEKRLQFNQFVEEELARAESERSSAGTDKLWKFSSSSSYGYDSNVNLDSMRRGDGFFQQIFEGGAEKTWGPGRWRLKGSAEFFKYDNHESSDYRSLILAPSFETQIAPKTDFKLQYELNSFHYIQNADLNYLGHRLRPSISYQYNKKFTQTFYTLAEWKDFGTRKALTAADTDSDHLRSDKGYEAGTGLRFSPDTKKVLGVTVAYKTNDSNDLFHDFNDSEGMKLSGYAYFQLPRKFSTIAYGGYHFKKYEARTFLTGSDETQEDDFFYLGNSLYYDVSPSWQVVFSYLYKQNYSNDPAQTYSGYTLTAGMNLML